MIDGLRELSRKNEYPDEPVRGAGSHDSAGPPRRNACRYLGLSRRVATYKLKRQLNDRSLGKQLIAATQNVPRLGYRRMAAWLTLSESRVRLRWRALQLSDSRPRP